MRLMQMSLRLMLPLMLLSLLPLSGCAHVSTDPVASEFCKIAEPISYDSDHDTAETIAQVETHNLRWIAVCEK